MRITKILPSLLCAALLVIVVCAPQQALAKKKVVDIYELSLDDNLETPAPENERIAERIEEFQYEVAVTLKKQNLEVELMRDNQVIVVTYLASQMFAPNDTVLTQVGKSALAPMLKFIKNPGMYKVLLVMHNDNTGSDEYTFGLSRSRVNAVFDWFDEEGSVDFVVPYALGATDPIVDNNSIDNRKKNRRLEIYLVPEESLLALAKKGRIDTKLLKTK